MKDGHRKDIRTFRKLRNYPVFMALSGILKIHVIAPEYKYYAVFLEYPPQYRICHLIAPYYSIYHAIARLYSIYHDNGVIPVFGVIP